jgi:lysophospholipase L1-like esterase
MKKIIGVFIAVLFAFVLIGCEDPKPHDNKVFDSIVISKMPTKLVYNEGETFDPTGIKIEAKYTVDGVVKETTDVTSKATYNKTTLSIGDTKVVASVTIEGVTKSADINITVNPLHELIQDGMVIDEIPVSSLIIETPSTKGNAKSHWFTEYKDNGFYIEVIVEDMFIDTGTNIYSSDGIEVMLYKVQRGNGLIDGTLLINATSGQLSVKKYSDGTVNDYTEHSVTSTFEKVSFNGTYVEGYRIEILVPYKELGLSSADRTVTFLPSLYNNQGGFANINTTSLFDVDQNQTRTFILVKDNNTYEANPWMQLGYTFGDIGSLVTNPIWDLTNDDGSANARAVMTGVATGTDNNAYMYRVTEPELYAYAKFNAKSVHNSERYGKFGLAVTTLDGKNGFFFFVDASGNGTDMTGRNISVVNRTDGSWSWPEKVLTSLISASDYQGDNFVELAIYRYGGIFEFYVNGSSVGIQSGFPGLETETQAVVSVISFNIKLEIKQYGVTNEESVLDIYRFDVEEISYLFIGDSYVDKAFWTNFGIDFDFSAVNLGVGGTKVGYWKAQAATLSTIYKPDNIIIHIGVNDINDGGLSGESVAASVKELIAILQGFYPDANIYYISIEPNNFAVGNFSKYQVVNSEISALAETNERVHYIDMVTPLGGVPGTPVAQYFLPDGLHLNADGYAIWSKQIKDALGIERTEVKDNLGDFGLYARSTGWTYKEGYVENLGPNEQQIYFSNVRGTKFAASVEISISGIYNNDAYPKAGFALKSASKTLFFFIDVNKELTNKWGNYVVRNSGADWGWAGVGGVGRQYVYLGDADYNSDNFKKIEIIRLGTAVYFISDNKVVQYAEGIFAEDEVTQLSVMVFNLDVKLKEAKIYQDAEFNSKLASFELAEKTGPAVDGSLADWPAAVLANPASIKGWDGRNTTIYAYLTDEGVYIAYDILHTNAPISNIFNWWENTNVEFRLGNNEQRFASANGMYARPEPDGRDGIGTASWSYTTKSGMYNTFAEIFVPWAMIDGYNASSAYVPAGFAVLNPGDKLSIWSGNDYSYVPEADPTVRTWLITSDGFYLGERNLDGDLTEWGTLVDSAVTKTDGGRQFKTNAVLTEEGLYGFFQVTLPGPLDMNTSNTADEWWMNPNIEVWINDYHCRIMVYKGQTYGTGRITSLGYSYDQTTNTLTFEWFTNRVAMGIDAATDTVQYRLGTNSIGGGWVWVSEPNRPVTSGGIQ